MSLEIIAAQAAAAQRIPKPSEVILDRSISHSPYAPIRHNEPFDFSGSTLGTGLTSDFSLSEFLTPASESLRYTPARQDSPASSDVPWGAAAGVGFLGYEAAAIAAARRSKHPWRTFGLTQAVGAFGVSCAAPMAEVLIIEKSPFTLSAESAISKIQELGSSFMIGNSKASLSDISCDSNGGTFNKITLKNDRSNTLSTAAFCTAKIKVGETLGAVGLVVLDTGDVFIANAPNGHFSISFDGKDATGQLALLTADHKLEQNTNASFGATLVDGKVDSISWVRIGDKTSTVDKSSFKESADSFVSLVSKPEFIEVSAVISSALNAPKATVTPELLAGNPTLTPRPTETNTPSATPTATAMETATPVPMSTLETSVIGLLDEMKVPYTKTNENGKVTLVNNETGKDILRDGRVEISYAVELAKKDCEPTDFEPDKWGFRPNNSKDENSFDEYMWRLIDDTRDSDYQTPDDFPLWDSLIDRIRQCWGLVGSDDLFYRDETGLAQVTPIIHLTQDEIDVFISSR